IFLGVYGQAKIRGDGSLSHAGMNRIRSQGLVSARRADTPSDPGDVVRVATAVSSHRRFTFRARTASFDSAGAKRKRWIASPLLRIEESGTMRLGLWLVRSTSMDPWLIAKKLGEALSRREFLRNSAIGVSGLDRKST